MFSGGTAPLEMPETWGRVELWGFGARSGGTHYLSSELALCAAHRKIFSILNPPQKGQFLGSTGLTRSAYEQ